MLQHITSKLFFLKHSLNDHLLTISVFLCVLVDNAAFSLDINPLPSDQPTDGQTISTLGTLNLLLSASTRAINSALVAGNISQRPSVSVCPSIKG